MIEKSDLGTTISKQQHNASSKDSEIRLKK